MKENNEPLESYPRSKDECYLLEKSSDFFE